LTNELLLFLVHQSQMDWFQLNPTVSFMFHIPIIVTDWIGPMALALGALSLLVFRAWKEIVSSGTGS